MKNGRLVNRLAMGAAAGAGATVAMQGMLTASQKWLPQTTPPMQQDPAAYMLHQAGSALPVGARERVPEKVQKGAGSLLHFGYGATAGLLYGALRPEDPNVLRDGLLLGLGVWAAGYLGWLPRAGLMPPVTQQRPAQVIGPVVQHALFGVAAVIAYGWLQRRLFG